MDSFPRRALDLSSTIKIVAASENLFVPDAIAERWLFPGPRRETRPLKWRRVPLAGRWLIDRATSLSPSGPRAAVPSTTFGLG